MARAVVVFLMLLLLVGIGQGFYNAVRLFGYLKNRPAAQKQKPVMTDSAEARPVPNAPRPKQKKPAPPPPEFDTTASIPATAIPTTPIKPLYIVPPEPHSAKWEDQDLSRLPEAQLYAMGRQLVTEKRYAEAAQMYYWSMRNGSNKCYDLACCFALTGNLNGALYYLQETPIIEGVDPAWVAQDPDFAVLRKDPRWPQVKRYLDDYARYWERTAPMQTELIVPAGYQPGTPVPAIVWLHGYSGNPKDWVDSDVQRFADALSVAIIGISATKARGPNIFIWSENAVDDYARLLKGLDSLRERVTLADDKIMLFGFSQGGKMACEIALMNPGRFKGALVVSAGGDKMSYRTIKEQSANKKQRFVFMAGDGENPQTLQMLRAGDALARRTGAKSRTALTPNQATHSFPADFDEKFGSWVNEILELSR